MVNTCGGLRGSLADSGQFATVISDFLVAGPSLSCFMDLERTFLQTIRREPHNPTHRLVFADWLQEQGDLRGELLSLQEQLRQANVPQRSRLEVRMHELLRAGVEPLIFRERNFLGMEFVLIFPGSFRMGTPDTGKRRPSSNENLVDVTLTEPFWLSTTVVTAGQWFSPELHSGRETPVGDKLAPAVRMNWTKAASFCDTLSSHPAHAGEPLGEFRLPTEAQWEYACRAGTSTRFSFGDDDDLLGEFSWRWTSLEQPGLGRVASARPNPWGLYDMHGLVDEWCRDAWSPRLPGGADPLVPSEWNHGRVVRGGNRNSSPQLLRSAFRTGFGLWDAYSDLGFRCIAQWKPPV